MHCNGEARVGGQPDWDALDDRSLRIPFPRASTSGCSAYLGRVHRH